MPSKRFSEIRADSALLKEIRKRVDEGEIELPDSVTEDSTSSVEGLPPLESDDAQHFILAVERTFGRPRGADQEQPAGEATPRRVRRPKS
jgi:hypothetical protein